MRRREIERKLQVDETEIFAAAPTERSSQPVKHLGSAGLRRVAHQRELPARLEAVYCLDDQRMARQGFVKGGEDLQCVAIVALTGQKAAVALHHTQRRRIEFVRALEALCGFFLLGGKIEDQCGMQILENGVPV